jgi:hypothetical protein
MLKHPLAPWVGKGFASGIEGMRKALQLQVQSRPKGGQQTDHLKRACFIGAVNWMQKYSCRAITGTDDSTVQVIAARLYEAVTGEPDATMKRACDVLRLPIAWRAAGKATMDGAASVAIAGMVPRRD